MNAKNKRSKSNIASNETNDSLKVLDNEFDKKMHELDLKYQIENRESSFNRARSITVGTSFGGTTELMMRGDGSKHLWCVMQPVEVIELNTELEPCVPLEPLPPPSVEPPAPPPPTVIV